VFAAHTQAPAHTLKRLRALVATRSDDEYPVSTTATDRFRERRRPGIDPKATVNLAESGHSTPALTGVLLASGWNGTKAHTPILCVRMTGPLTAVFPYGKTSYCRRIFSIVLSLCELINQLV
jgi:hypothetical protein